MADYYSILKKTIASLPEKNGAARRSVYSRARNAIVNQLKAYEPPLSPSEITAEQLRLEEAIRKVEAEAARESLGLGPAAKPEPSSPPAPQAGGTQPADAPAEQPADTASGSSTAPDYREPEPPASPYPQATTPEPQAAPPVPPVERSAPIEPPKDDEAIADTAPQIPSPLKNELADAERLGSASSSAVSSSRLAFEDQLDASDNGKQDDKAGGNQSSESSLDDDELFVDQKANAPSDRREPSIASSDGAAGRRNRKPRKSAGEALAAKRRPALLPMLLIGVLVLILASIAGVIYSQRDLIASLTGPSVTEEQPEPETASVETVPQEPEATEDEANDSGKITDRLIDPDGEPPVAPDARSVTTTLITPGQTETRLVEPEPPAAPVDVTPVVPPQPDATPPVSQETGNQPAAAPSGEAEQDVASIAPGTTTAPANPVPSAQRSILYEEGAEASGAGTAAQGAVVWSLEEETALDGSAQTVLTADVEIPERDVTVNLRIKPNDDASLPASHLVEIKYELPEEFASGTVVNVPGLVMKPTEEARGDALLGASVKVSEGYFWIALSSLSSEQERNLGLLRERGWIDIPMLYTNGKRGILTLEKGPTGTDAVEKAIAAWTS